MIYLGLRENVLAVYLFSWRPAFKYYNKWVSLFSTFLCVGLMFGMAWIYATVTVVCQASLHSIS